jgi:hypothetical protein
LSGSLRTQHFRPITVQAWHLESASRLDNVVGTASFPYDWPDRLTERHAPRRHWLYERDQPGLAAT